MTFPELRQQVLQLPLEERQNLAYELVTNLATESGEDSWLETVSRRQQEVKDGKVNLIDRVQFMKEMRQEFGW